MSQSIRSEKRLVENYLAEHEIEKVVNEVLNNCLRERPDDPFHQIGTLLKERSKAGKGLKSITGNLIYGVDGEEVYEIQIGTDYGNFRGAVSSFRIDNVFKKLGGSKFQEAANRILAQGLVGQDPSDLEVIDDLILGLDDSPDKLKLGGNTILAASMAIARVGAASKGLDLHQHLAQVAGRAEFAIPVPWITVLTLENESIGVVPSGANNLVEAVQLTEKLTKAVDRLELSSKTDINIALEKVLSCISDMEIDSKLKLAISVNESDAIEDAAEDQATASAETTAANETSSEEKEDKSEQKSENNETVAALASAEVVHDRSKTLNAVKKILEDEEKRNMIVVLENVFNPSQVVEMESFVEEYGETVVLFNKADRKKEKKQKNETTVGETPPADNAVPSDGESKAEEKKSEEEKVDVEIEAGQEEDEDDDLPPFNGDKLYVGIPTGDMCTVSELIQELEMFQSQGQAVAIVWEEAKGSAEEFPADFAVGLGVGLMKFGDIKNPNNVPKLNQLLRLEQQLASEAFYAGGRFRAPFN